MIDPSPPPQLHMLFPKEKLAQVSPPCLPAGYQLRAYRDGDEKGFFRVMELAGFGLWDAEKLNPVLERVLPDGFFFAIHTTSGQIVATAMATHRPLDLHPFGGELSWVAGDPAHVGRGLGMAVCTAVLQRFHRAGYHRVFLRTDDFRLPALKIYLKLGFLPLLYQEDMETRWETICQALKWPFTPTLWPQS